MEDTTQTKTTDDIFREELEANRREAMVAAGKRSEYVKAKVLQFGPKFWDRMQTLADSENEQDTKLFIQEFNKIQAKIVPAELQGANGEAIQVNVIDFKNSFLKKEEE